MEIKMITTITMIKCDHCGKQHPHNSEGFMRFCGSVYMGQSGGLIGPYNYEDYHFCYPDCVKQVLMLK